MLNNEVHESRIYSSWPFRDVIHARTSDQPFSGRYLQTRMRLRYFQIFKAPLERIRCARGDILVAALHGLETQGLQNTILIQPPR